jgi:hypothetical protein
VTATPALDALAGLSGTLGEHWDALEADFQRFYGLDLGAACYGPRHLGARRLRALIAHLPPESAMARVMGWWWTDQHEMAAQLIELTYVGAQAAVASVNVASAKKWKPQPVKYPRPSMPTPALPSAQPAPGAGLTRESIRSILSSPQPRVR